MSETDATGVLYFTNQLKFATEAFEEGLERIFPEMSTTFEEYGFPIVEAHSFYLAPLFHGDEIEIFLMVESMGTASVTFLSLIHKDGAKVGETRIKHVLVSKKTRRSVPIPEEWKSMLAAGL